MTTNKPEVVAYRYTASRSFGKRNPKWHYQESFPHVENRKVEEIGRLEKLISLSDYETLQADYEKLRNGLAEAQANDRTAMGYLSDVRKAVGGKDFPEMVRNVTELVEAASELAPYAGGMESIIRDFAGCLGKAEALVSRAKAVERLLGMLPQPETCPGAGCTDQGCPAHYADPTPQPAEQQPDPTDMQILAITTAYEQGVGKGHDAHHRGEEIQNPYGTSWGCDKAWQMGYEEGKEQAANGTKSSAVTPRPTPDVSALVEALECALETMENVDGANDCSRGIDAVEEALAAHRKHSSKGVATLQSQDREDAERYRTLVASGKFVPATLSTSCLWGLRTGRTKATKAELDEAIDAHRKQGGDV